VFDDVATADMMGSLLTIPTFADVLDEEFGASSVFSGGRDKLAGGVVLLLGVAGAIGGDAAAAPTTDVVVRFGARHNVR
jgi:hypothetical protein